MNWADPVTDNVGNSLLSRVMGADVRLDPAGFDFGIRLSWEEALQPVRDGAVPRDSNVLYAHLGGQPALNAYSGVFEG